MSNLTVFEPISKEFDCDKEGKVSLSRRGLAKLCGVQHKSWKQSGSIFTLKIDQYLIEQGIKPGSFFDENDRIPDMVASLIIQYYAFAGNKTAQKSMLAMGAIGLRTIGQQLNGYKATKARRLTPEEIVELCVLPAASEWQRRFPEEYYSELERLTNLKAIGHKRPAYWAKLTKNLVYDYLPEGIYTAVKQCKEETGGYDKLHQFLSEDGLKILESHQRSLLTLMKAASSVNELNRLLKSSSTRVYQMLIF